MAELETRKNDASLDGFLNALPEEQKRKDAL
jgi:hypothetical protein